MDIQIENLAFRYGSFGGHDKQVLDGINLTIRTGEFLALVGPSGSGKTTLMQHLTGLLQPTRGTIRLAGRDLWSKKTNRQAIRTQIGLVFQFPESQFFEETVFADVSFGPRNLGLSDAEVASRVEEAITSVGLDFERYRDRAAFRLSEGEKRRIAIAGILAMQPEVLVLDEPTAGLDAAGITAVSRILQAFHARGKTVLLISHDMNLISRLVQRIVLLADGRIVFDGNKRELFQQTELLSQAGLPLPRVARLAATLYEKGWIESPELDSMEKIKASLSRRLHQNEKLFRNQPLAEK